LHLKRETRAVSTFLFILIILASLIIGGLITYIWAIVPYYNVPANPSLLSVESVAFPLDNFNSFYVTVLNPSYSVSDLNITGFQVSIPSQNETFSVGTTDPAVPFVLSKGTEQNFTCYQNWSVFAGQSVTVEPIAANASVYSQPYVVPMVKLVVSGFNPDDNVNSFNLTVQNSPESVINLTISDITIFGVPVTNSTPSLSAGFLLPIGQVQVFNCTYNWARDGGENLTITVTTDVGYEQVFETSPIATASPSISNVSFDNTDTSYFNITINNPSTSEAQATLSGVNVTLADNTTVALRTSPPLAGLIVFVAPNASQNLECFWNWNAYRDEQILVQAFTLQGFPVQNKTVTTPSASIWSVNNVQFDLDDLEHFTVNVTNAPASLGNINITEVDFDQYNTSMSPVVVAPANSSLVVCSFNWTSFVGLNANVTVYGVYVPTQNETTITETQSLPYVKVADAQFSSFPTGNPYVNVTVFESQFSPLTANITQISVTVNNVTSVLDGTLSVPTIGSNGYVLSKGEQMTFVCPWNWSTGQSVTFTVQLAQGPAVSATFTAG
jgi:hypothetical protein